MANGRDNVIELIFRSVNETGAGINAVIQGQQRVAQAAQQSSDQQRASVAPVTAEFARLRAQIVSLGEGYQKSGTVGTQSRYGRSVMLRSERRTRRA
jgi:hypothetical protein